MRKLLTKCFQWCLIAFAVAGGTQALAQTRTASALKPLDYVQRYRSELDKDDFDYAGTARGLFYFYVAQGNLERALPLISEIDWGWRGEALILIEEAAKKGPRKLLLRTLDIALAREKKENPDEPDNRFLSQLVVLLIRFQETERAESLAEKLAPNELGTVDAFLALAEAQLHTDREKATQFLERARREIDLEDLENILWHCQWLKKIAQAYQTLAEPQKVAEILVVIKELAPQENELKRDYPLSELAEGYALNGEFDQATQLADKFALENRLTAYTRLAVICLRQGERKRGLALLESALRLTEQLEGEYAKGGDLERIVRVYLSADLPDAAAKTVKLIKYDYHLQEAATAFADWCLKRNQPEKALEVLDFAAQELKSLVSEKREEIEPQMSFSIARSKAGGLAEIAAKYRQMGQLERALDTAKAIDLP